MKTSHAGKEEAEKALEKALALKQREKPPEQFFQKFSDRVMDRLHGPEPAGPVTWRQRLGVGEDWKPAYLWLLGVLVCSALAAGLVAAFQVKQPEAGLPDSTDPSVRAYSPEAKAPGTPSGFEPLPASPEAAPGTVPVVTPDSTGATPTRPVTPKN